jgi:hypothetical protein
MGYIPFYRGQEGLLPRAERTGEHPTIGVLSDPWAHSGERSRPAQSPKMDGEQTAPGVGPLRQSFPQFARR